MTPIVAERLAELDRFHLEAGSHKSVNEGVCIMELAAYVAGRDHTDSPQCVSPVIAAFMRRWNDDLDDEGRQRLKPLIPVLLDTADPSLEERRGWMAADWLVRVHTPTWLELAGITEAASALRALPELRDLDTLKGARPAINRARKDASAAGAAAWAAAWDVAWAAAWDVARAAAGAAARAAAGAAAWDAAGAAAGAAAAKHTKYDAARKAAERALAPTQQSLQRSAYELVERMCALSKEPA